jgi:hypothetical protein
VFTIRKNGSVGNGPRRNVGPSHAPAERIEFNAAAEPLVQILRHRYISAIQIEACLATQRPK